MSNYPPPVPSLLKDINSFSGLNLDVNPSRIADNEATLMENFYIKENGVLSKRLGLTYKFSIDNEKVLAMKTYKDKLILGTNKALYSITTTSTTPVTEKIYTYDVFPITMKMFIFNSLLYIVDGFKFKCFDGTDIKNIQDHFAYVPTLFITCSPNGSGVPLEQWNMLGRKYKQSYSADGTSKEYLTCLGETDIIEVRVNNSIMTTGFTSSIDINTGKTKITFETAPTKGTDNIIVTCEIRMTGTIYKDKILPNITRINKNFVYSFYGGQNDTRLLLAGADSVFYRSDVNNLGYFPENYYQSVGDTEEKITGFVTQYDYCVILKENSIWHTRFELLADGKSVYITKPLNNQYGCVNGNTIQLIENTPMFLSGKGISVVNQTQLRDERNVEVISYKANELILKETVSYFRSIDFDNKYILANKNIMYIYDYICNCFYVWKFETDKFCIESLTEINGELYIGTDTGSIYKLRNETELEATLNGAFPFEDEFRFNNQITKIPIKCTWKSKLFSFDDTNKYKMIEKLFLTTSVSEQTSCNISYITNRNTIVNVGTSFNNLFKYNYFDYSKFTYLSSVFPVTDKFKIKAKKILFYQLVLENSQPEETLDIYNIGIKFKYQKEVK